MDNLSDYVPLILILGSVIYSIVKGMGKKGEEETAKTTLPGKTAKEVGTKEMKSPQKKKSKKKVVVPIQTNPIKKDSKKAIQRPNVAPISISEDVTHVENNQETIPYLDTHDREEIKQAFIYSEILNRKEY